MESRPDWWKEASSGGYDLDIDSWTFARSLENLQKNDKVNALIDLGCGAAKPALSLILGGANYIGLDIQEKMVREASANIARTLNASKTQRATRARKNNSKVAVALQNDVLNQHWFEDELVVKSLKNGEPWEAVVANLPYLPGPHNKLPIEVDGGFDGLRFVPDRVLEIAQHISARLAVINVSSLSNLDEFAVRTSNAGYGVIRVVATVAPLEGYAKSVYNYLVSQPFVKFMDLKMISVKLSSVSLSNDRKEYPF